jgi:HK97 gp10 family phage protein
MAKKHRVSGIGATIRAFDNYEKGVEKEIGEVISRGAIDITRDAIRRAPRDTGNLARSIRSVVSKKKLVALVGTNVKYSSYQELGTSRMKAQPYLVPAFNRNKVKILKGIKEALIKGGKGI